MTVPPKSTPFRCENGHTIWIKVPRTCIQLDARAGENHECFECGKPMAATDPHCLSHLDAEMRKDAMEGRR